jgi:hypothetical protein
LATAAGLDWSKICSLDEAALEQRLLSKPAKRSAYAMPNYGRIHHELRRKGMTLMLLWEEAGKSWLACALTQYACRREHSALYQRVPRLPEELRVRHGSGAFGRWLIQLAKTDVLGLDDWGMGALDSSVRSDLLEIIDDRAANKATIITSQFPIEHWHAWIGDATIADAIMDRVMQRHQRFTLTGDSLRQSKSIPVKDAA